MSRAIILFFIFLYSQLSIAVDQQKRVTLNFQEAPVGLVLQALADYQQLNLIMDEKISGQLTLRLEQVPWQKALEIILRMKQLKVEIDSNVLLVSLLPTAESLRQEKQQEAEDQEQQAPLVSRSFKLQHSEATVLSELLKSQLSPRGSLIADKRSNALLLRDIASVVPAFEESLAELDQPQPQVQIAAHIVTIRSEKLHDLGVNWGLSEEQGSANSLRFKQFNVDLPTTNAAVKAGIHFARFNGRLLDLELSALESENEVEIIANPRLMTASQHTASIKQGTELPYEVSSGANGATSIEFKEAVLGMEVTPRVLHDGKIELTLLISQNMPGRSIKQGEGETLAIDKQEIQTQVTVTNGETLALGGIFQQINEKGNDKVPGLGNIPLLGNLFQRESRQHSRRELVIFITPTLVEK